MKILLVEDDLDLAQTLVEYLALEDIVCDHVSNGIGGEELACRNDYDVLVLDVNLPGQDGFRSCHNLRLSGGGYAGSLFDGERCLAG
ncbi:response regulator [Thiomicrorhabdus sp.]|uniref:response regulator n=1 Tax=Thiomicrorhabdus sp. TaxID=2039724 RepID=UPI0029C69C69|nr:response regulator [Thiomicrorhabdus sp.]